MLRLIAIPIMLLFTACSPSIENYKKDRYGYYMPWECQDEELIENSMSTLGSVFLINSQEDMTKQYILHEPTVKDTVSANLVRGFYVVSTRNIYLPTYLPEVVALSVQEHELCHHVLNHLYGNPTFHN